MPYTPFRASGVAATTAIAIASNCTRSLRDNCRHREECESEATRSVAGGGALFYYRASLQSVQNKNTSLGRIGPQLVTLLLDPLHNRICTYIYI